LFLYIVRSPLLSLFMYYCPVFFLYYTLYLYMYSVLPSGRYLVLYVVMYVFS